MIALVLANGELNISPELLKSVKDADHIIAADGGAKHCVQLNCTPDIIIGDLDSVSDDIVQSFKARGTAVLQFPVRKDATDLELAIDHAIEQGATTIHCAGLLGGRWDMSLSNIFLLAHEKYQKVNTTIFGEDCIMHILHPGNSTFTTKDNLRTSIIPLKNTCEHITLTGFEYPLNNYSIPFGSSIGLSNVTCEPKVQIKHTGGVLLLIFSQNMG